MTIQRLIDFQNQPTLYQCESAWHWKPPVFQDFDFWAVLGGRGKLRVGDQVFALSGGDTFLLRPGDSVEGSQTPEFPIRVIAFHFFPGEACPMDIETLPGHRKLHGLRALEFYARDLVRLAARADISEEPQAALVALLLLSLLNSPSQVPNSRDERLRSAAELMRSAPGEIESITALARRFGMASAHFSRVFKHLHNETPVAFWNRARRDRAAVLLRETHLPLDEIADMLGYCNTYHFSRHFKAAYGQPPARWRQLLNTCPHRKP